MSKMSDEERTRMVAQMDKDLEEFIVERMKNSKRIRDEREERGEVDELDFDFDNLDVDETAEKLKQHPAFMTEFDPSKPLSPEMEALQALKYESEDAEDNAISYKEDGNRHFKLSKYRWAIENYTAGIKELPRDKQLNAILYTNRAAAQFRIGNYRSAFKDCIIARKFKVDHMKAVIRGIHCCIQLRRYNDALRWCEDGLLIEPTDEQTLELRSKADKLKRQDERDKRKQQVKERKEKAERKKLVDAVKSRGIHLAPSTKPQRRYDDSDDEDGAGNDELMLEGCHPSGAVVHVGEDGALQWPVMFVYPQHTQSDFIEAFHENSMFGDHLEHMFGKGTEPIPWDREREFKPESIKIYFEDREKERLYEVSQSSTLLEVLKHPKYLVQSGTPSFILLVKGNKFTKDFLDKYKL